MTSGTFGPHSFIPFIASQFITDFGQQRHDPTPVLTNRGRLAEGLLLLLPGMLSNTRGTIEGTTWTEQGIP